MNLPDKPDLQRRQDEQKQITLAEMIQQAKIKNDAYYSEKSKDSSISTKEVSIEEVIGQRVADDNEFED